MSIPRNSRLVSPEPRITVIKEPPPDYKDFRRAWKDHIDSLYNDLEELHQGIRQGAVHPKVLTWPDGDATPSVGVPDPGIHWAFTEAYTGATNVTTFDDGQDGQTFTIHFTSGNITLKDGSTLALADGGADFVGYAGWNVTFQYVSSVWCEISRSET